MKSFVCRINIHDWEILERKSAIDIRTKYNEKNKCNAEPVITFEYSTYFCNRICMKCNKIDNGIKENEFLLFQAMRRRDLALEKFEKED